MMLVQLHSPEIDVCWFQTLPSRNVAVCCTCWRLSGSDSSGTVLFSPPKTNMASKVILRYLVNVVESVLMWGTGLEPVLSSLIISLHGLCDRVCDELAGS